MIRRLLRKVSKRRKAPAAPRPKILRVATPDNGERPPEWYDNVYENRQEYSVHYTKSVYYPLWTVIIDRLRAMNARSILEIGCGSGQLAQAVREVLPPVHYYGFDISPVAVEMAAKSNPDYRFEIADALETELYRSVDYDCVIATEVLEHIERDRDVVRSISGGSRFIGSVPNFDSESHVRFFKSASEVKERYESLFDALSVSTIIFSERKAEFYLLDGRIAGERS